MIRNRDRFSALGRVGLCLLILLWVSSCVRQEYSYTLTLVHLNDTHSHLEALPVTLTVDGVRTTAVAGGFPRLKTAVDEMRAVNPGMLLLHGGDAVQGTLYFTLFNGEVEYDFLNLLGIDAMTFGNHEFDRGCTPIPGWIDRSAFPWISANIDFSGEPDIAARVRPTLIKDVGGERVAVIGLTTETTPEITRNVGHAVFLDAVESTRRQVNLLTAQGINKIIVLSHLGYDRDRDLARSISGVDIVVGGHSHSLLGQEEGLAHIGLVPVGDYPTALVAPDGKRVLVLQAWRWGHVLGRMHVRFSKDGEILAYTARATVPVGDAFVQNGQPVDPSSPVYAKILEALAASGTAKIYAEDPAVVARLAPYAEAVEQFRSVKVATAVNPITIGLNSGPGPLACDSMLAAFAPARAAILNYGGVRRDLTQGDITVGDVLEVMPFGNTLVLVDLTGAEIKDALEEDIDYLLAHYPGYDPPLVPYVGGMTFSFHPQAQAGSRVLNLKIRDAQGDYCPAADAEVYSLVTNAFVAGGGDGFAAIKNATGFRSDTGMIDGDAFREYLKALIHVENPTEQRVVIVP